MNTPPPISSASPAECEFAESYDLMSSRQRMLFGVVGSGLIGLLITARLLSPSPDGMGTHRQLGLPPCTSVALFGIRCPSCGMTTSWAYATRGRLVASARANFGGMLLALAAAAMGPWMAVSAVRGRYITRPPDEWWVLGISLAIAAATLVDWGFRLSQQFGASG